MGTSERQLFRARFAWLCKWLLSDVYGGDRLSSVSAREKEKRKKKKGKEDMHAIEVSQVQMWCCCFSKLLARAYGCAQPQWR